MSAYYKIIRKEDFQTTAWLGGTTTQMAIFPESAEYAKRNFSWRISTAVINVEETEFTRLPGYWRLLMATGGQFTLQHENRHRAILRPFDQDSFDGGWTTRCYGRGDDLNVMLASGWTAEIECISLLDSASDRLQDAVDRKHCTSFECIHPIDGDILVKVSEDVPVLLPQGELLIYKKEGHEPNVHFQYVNPNTDRNEPVLLIRITIH
ncbi:HutD family protein [Cohnella sp.]|uniref:HutD/Ves family protein n=1 Tax=Cohnella sp. TaxID=1883426 RepID=UPI0035674E96